MGLKKIYHCDICEKLITVESDESVALLRVMKVQTGSDIKNVDDSLVVEAILCSKCVKKLANWLSKDEQIDHDETLKTQMKHLEGKILASQMERAFAAAKCNDLQHRNFGDH